MSILSKLFGATPVSSIVGTVSDLAGKIFGTSEDEVVAAEQKAAFDLAVENHLHEKFGAMEETLRIELGAKERILIAELQQGDNYTIRARPTVVYYGLFLITLNYSILPAFGLPVFPLPPAFLIGWSGIVATWSVGRDSVRKEKRNKLVDAITGDGKGIPGLLGL